MIEFNIERNIVGRGPDLMPLIDMVFILLIFFLLTSTAIQPAVDVALPETDYGETKIATSIVVSILADGTLLINGNRVPEELFLPVLESQYREQPDAELTIQADRQVPFGRVVEIMDLSKQAGAEEVSFLVETKVEE